MTESEDVRCWRCDRKLFELQIEPGRVIPPNVVVNKKCDRCKAMNRIPLDKVYAVALP